MKTKFFSLSLLSTLALALSSATGAVQAFQPTTTGGGYSSQHQPVALVAQTQTKIAATGTFVAAEKPTTGTAQIVVEQGKRYLVLSADFKTSNQGPDLHVVLDPASQPPAQYQDKTTFVNLGKLQKFAGTQRYAIPTSVDLSQFKSVGIWCQMANATFGYAPLQPSTTASL